MTQEASGQPAGDSGSFSSGLMMGFLIGAVGYFLVKTKEGEKIRTTLAQHWQTVAQNLTAEGKLCEGQKDIPDYIQAIRAKINEFLGSDETTTTENKKNTKKKSTRAKKSIFKGL